MTDEAWIDTVRLARDFGTVRELFPDGIDDLRDLPHTLFEQIRSALLFLSFEELAADERPPRRIWTEPAKLADWFDDVRRRRDAQFSAPTGREIEDPVENLAAKDLIVG